MPVHSYRMPLALLHAALYLHVIVTWLRCVPLKSITPITSFCNACLARRRNDTCNRCKRYYKQIFISK